MIEIGILKIEVQIQAYRDELANNKSQLEELSKSAEQLRNDSAQYLDYASDEDQRFNISNCKNGLDVMAKTFSTAQIVNLGKEVDKLKKMSDTLENVMNKEEQI